MVCKFGDLLISYLKPISILQKKLARIITFSHPRSHSEPILKNLNLLKFTDISNLQILTFVYQWIHELTPDTFRNYFELISDKHIYQTRQAQNLNLFIKSVNATQYGLQSIQYIGPTLWNSLPTQVKLLPSVSSFRKHILTETINILLIDITQFMCIIVFCICVLILFSFNSFFSIYYL